MSADFVGNCVNRMLAIALAAVALLGCEDELALRAPLMKAIAIGEYHSCGLIESGEAYCWGDGSSGQLGTGAMTSQRFAVPVATGGVFASIAAGGSHTCALTPDGITHCWGLNNYGQAGIPDVQQVLAPRPVNTGLRFAALSVGWEHTCGLGQDGTAYCWGRGGHGELGNGAIVESVSSPIAVVTNLKFRLISAGGRHSCGIAVSGAAYCWGANELAQLGIGAESEPRPVPVRVDASVGFVDISAGFNHTCAVDTGGTAYCWGENRYGEIGNGGHYKPDLPAERRPTPIAAFGAIYVSVSAGRFYSCGRRDQDELMCWGRGANGQLGNRAMRDSDFPQLVHVEPGQMFTPGRGVFATFDAGGSTHACGVTVGGSALCWGQGAQGQLGSGEWLSMIPYPVLAW